MRRSTIKPSRGTVWPADVSAAIWARDKGCVGPRVGMPGACEGPAERDHIRAGGTSIKSRSTLDNGALLCSNVHHPLKTMNGRVWRPVLIDYVNGECVHVDPVFGCSSCERRWVRA